MIKTTDGDSKADPNFKIEVNQLGEVPTSRKNIDPKIKAFSDTFQEISSLLLFVFGICAFTWCGYHDHLKKQDTEKVIKRIELKKQNVN